MTNDSILDKIRHLFAMAEHETANEHEAATALEKAQALLLRHNLTRASVGTANGHQEQLQGIGKVSVSEEQGYSWKRTLLHVIARNNLCQVIGKTSGPNTCDLFGSQDNVRAVLEMYYWVGEQLEKLATQGLRAYKREGGRENGRTWKSGFFQGAARIINQRLAKPMQEFAAYGSGKDLVLFNDASLKQAVAKIYPHTRKTGRRVPMGDGYGAGKAAGHGVTFGAPKRIGGNLALGSGR